MSTWICAYAISCALAAAICDFTGPSRFARCAATSSLTIAFVSRPEPSPEIDWVMTPPAPVTAVAVGPVVVGAAGVPEPEIADVTLRSFRGLCGSRPGGAASFVPESEGGGGVASPTPSIGEVLRHCRSSWCYWSSLRIVCGTAFACASMAVPACKRIWSLVKLTISSDMLVSTIWDSEADRF